MKHFFLYLFFLILPLQEREPISFDDIISIGSVESFNRVMVENGFDFIRNNMLSELLIGLGGVWDPSTMADSINESFWYYGWNEERDDPLVLVSMNHTGNILNVYVSDDSIFESILSETRKRCNFYGMLWDSRFSSYDCPDAKFDDDIYLGFTKNAATDDGGVASFFFDGSPKVNHIKFVKWTND
jgi:hypothetical protein